MRRRFMSSSACAIWTGTRTASATLGGSVLTESAMGPYEVCACRDDQGTPFHLWRDPAR